MRRDVIAKQIKALDDTILLIEEEVRSGTPHPWSESICPLCKVFNTGEFCTNCPIRIIRLPLIKIGRMKGAYCSKVRRYYKIERDTVNHLKVMIDILKCLKDRLVKRIVYY